MDYDGIEPVTDEEEVFSFIKPAILTPGASERTHRYNPHGLHRIPPTLARGQSRKVRGVPACA